MGVLTNEELRVIVQNCLKTTEFEVLESEWTELSSQYECFSGKSSRLTLTVKKSDQEQPTCLTFFVKEHPESGGFHREFLKSIKIFYKETHLYHRMLNKFSESVKSKIFAKCYFTRPDEVLVLEDLTSSGFKRKGLHETCTVEETELALASLAKLHAASILYEEQHETKINKAVGDALFEPLFVSNPEHNGFHHLCVGINVIETIVEAYFSHVSNSVCEKAYNLMRGLPERMKPSTKRRNVLNHANLWVNNILFSYNYEGKVEEARLIDFKFARYCPGAFDVLLFLYMSTSHGLRETDLESLLIFYYNKLGRELADSDININTIMSWSEFKSSVDEELPTVLAITPFYLHFYLLPNERIQKILRSSEKYESFIKEDRSQIVLDVMRTDETFRKRVSQSVTDLLDYIKHH